MHRDVLQEAGRNRTAHDLKMGENGALAAYGLRHAFAREFLIEKKLKDGP